MTPHCTLCLNSPTERVVYRNPALVDALLCDDHVDDYIAYLRDTGLEVVGLSDVEAVS